MSYDVWLEADLGGKEPVSLRTLDANYTWNISPMITAAVGHTPSDWDGVLAAQVAEITSTILSAFNADPAKFRALNPDNGWGDFEGARAFIQKINDACRDAPAAIMRVG